MGAGLWLLALLLPGLLLAAPGPPAQPSPRPRDGEARCSRGLRCSPVRVRMSCRAPNPQAVRQDVIDSVVVLRGPYLHPVNDSYLTHCLAEVTESLRQLPAAYRWRPVAARFGDSTEPPEVPVLGKARVIGARGVALLALNRRRHFPKEVAMLLQHGDPVPYEEKRPVALWRGVTTGTGDWDPEGDPGNPQPVRRQLLERWASNTKSADVGLTGIVQQVVQYQPHYERFLKPSLSIRQQLGYRYLVSVEGNDVASGLKWMLASNSTVLMPPPTKETWALESCLRPWVHYVPLRSDVADLAQKVAECEADRPRCAAIAGRATDFVRKFVNPADFIATDSRTLRQYMDTVEIQLDAATEAVQSSLLVACRAQRL
eukprot:EG_transcript_11878